MSRPPRRLPLAPLLNLVDSRWLDSTHSAQGSIGYQGKMTRLCRVHQSQVARALRDGSVTIATADRLAVALGVHPSEVWAEWWEI